MRDWRVQGSQGGTDAFGSHNPLALQILDLVLHKDLPIRKTVILSSARTFVLICLLYLRDVN